MLGRDPDEGGDRVCNGEVYTPVADTGGGGGGGGGGGVGGVRTPPRSRNMGVWPPRKIELPVGASPSPANVCNLDGETLRDLTMIRGFYL